MSTTKFFHSEEIYNLASPREIVPVLMEIFNPRSVVDFGCGLGTFLYCFKEQGVSRVTGMDGDWVDRSLLRKYLDDNEFIATNLQNGNLAPQEKYDLAMSLEVAEHLSPDSADRFVANITSLSDNIVFSAAIPGQGGQDHINEQWPSYWIKKFEQHGYTCSDILRPRFWNNPNILWWYKQNMLVFSKDPSFKVANPGSSRIVDIVHPELLKANAETLQGFKFATKLFTRACLKKLHLI